MVEGCVDVGGGVERRSSLWRSRWRPTEMLVRVVCDGEEREMDEERGD